MASLPLTVPTHSSAGGSGVGDGVGVGVGDGVGVGVGDGVGVGVGDGVGRPLTVSVNATVSPAPASYVVTSIVYVPAPRLSDMPESVDSKRD